MAAAEAAAAAADPHLLGLLVGGEARSRWRRSGRSRDRSSWRDQGCPEVVDVGPGRAGDEAVAQHLEEAVAVVVVEHGLRVAALGAGARQRVGREDGAGDVLGAVDAVGVGGQAPDAGRAVGGDRLAPAGIRRCGRRGPCRAPSRWSRRRRGSPSGLPPRLAELDRLRGRARRPARAPRLRDCRPA